MARRPRLALIGSAGYVFFEAHSHDRHRPRRSAPRDGQRQLPQRLLRRDDRPGVLFDLLESSAFRTTIGRRPRFRRRASPTEAVCDDPSARIRRRRLSGSRRQRHRPGGAAGACVAGCVRCRGVLGAGLRGVSATAGWRCALVANRLADRVIQERRDPDIRASPRDRGGRAVAGGVIAVPGRGPSRPPG
ncbi:MAG: hypothetical protein MZW92_20260 [Comamonadaceae bacterium]|nr:hypothetical protein [Comamonadaceae bacterium]